jgi:hypothetical protein
MIPKIIHQIWVGPKPAPIKYIQTWKDMNPEWEHILWNDEEISKRYPKGFKNQKQINEIEEWAGKADIMRYEILHDFGGFYADADSICVNGLDDHFVNHDAFAGFENEVARGNLIANGYIGATKGNKLMTELINRISKMPSVSQKVTGRMAWQNVGPLFFTETIIQTKYPISVYPSYLFIPEHYSGQKYSGNGKVYARQLWGSTKELSNPNYYTELSTEKEPKLSVLIPIYKIDNLNWFRQCIDSIDNQTFKDFEVVIVNDGSPQNEVIEFLKELQVRTNYTVVNLSTNVGVGPALNEGMKHCKCNLIARMDADDVMFPTRLEDQYNHMINNPDIDVLSAGIVYMQEKDGQLVTDNQGAIHPEVITKEIAKTSFWYVNHPTVMLRKDRVLSIGGYRDLRGLPEDYELWTRMINADMQIRNLQKVLVGYRLSENQASKGSASKTKFLYDIQSTIK